MEKNNMIKNNSENGRKHATSETGSLFVTDEILIAKAKRLSFLRQKKEEYASSFTVHGLSRIYNGSRKESLAWIFVVSAAIIFSSFFAQQLASRYLNYEIYTDVKQKVVKRNVFPAVTFCDSSRFVKYLDRYCGMNAYEADDLPPNEVCKENYKIDVKPPTITNDDLYFWGDGYYEVHGCKGLGGKNCLNSKYLKSLDRFDYACFRWNHDGEFSDIYGNVKLNFSVNTSSEYPHLGFIRAYIHDARVTGMEITNTVLMEPSRTYVVGVEKTLHKRLPAPYPSKCENILPDTVFHGKYSRSICAELQDFIDVYKRCGDVYDNWRPYIPKEIKENYKRNRTIREVHQCMENMFTNEAIEDAQLSNCPFPCEEREYLTIATSHGIDGKMNKDEYLDTTIYRLELQLQSVNSYRVLEEKPLFPLYQLLGEFGGLLGLITGASVISIIEIVTFVYLSIAQRIMMRNEPHHNLIYDKSRLSVTI